MREIVFLHNFLNLLTVLTHLIHYQAFEMDKVASDFTSLLLGSAQIVTQRVCGSFAVKFLMHLINNTNDLFDDVTWKGFFFRKES
jgi:uncharacterized membrane protein